MTKNHMTYPFRGGGQLVAKPQKSIIKLDIISPLNKKGENIV